MPRFQTSQLQSKRTTFVTFYSAASYYFEKVCISPHQKITESDWKRSKYRQLLPSASKLVHVEPRPGAFFLTELPRMHWIQMGRMALVPGISSNLFNCALNKTSKEHIDALPLRIAWKRTRSTQSVSRFLRGSKSVCWNVLVDARTTPASLEWNDKRKGMVWDIGNIQCLAAKPLGVRATREERLSDDNSAVSQYTGP